MHLSRKQTKEGRRPLLAVAVLVLLLGRLADSVGIGQGIEVGEEAEPLAHVSSSSCAAPRCGMILPLRRGRLLLQVQLLLHRRGAGRAGHGEVLKEILLAWWRMRQNLDADVFLQQFVMPLNLLLTNIFETHE